MKRLLFAVLLLPVFALAAGVSKPSAVSGSGTSTTQITAPNYVSTAASGSNGFACTVDGCRIDLGTGANDYWYSDGTSPASPGTVVAAFFRTSGAGGLFSGSTGQPVILRGQVVDGGTAAKVYNVSALTTGEIIAFYSDAGSTKKGQISAAGRAGWVGGMTTDIDVRWTATVAIPTCAAGVEGAVYRNSGGTSGARTKLCLCTSDGAGTPAYAWKNISVSGGTDASTIGNTTTCP